MSDLRDFTGKNRRFTGSDSIRLPRGSTAQQVSPETGEIRYNESGNYVEYYNGTIWRALTDPPTVTSITPVSVQEINADDSTTTTTFTIVGTAFDASVNVSFKDTADNIVTALTVTRDSPTQLTVVAENGDFADLAANEPFDVIVTNGTGLSATLSDAISVNQVPVWVTPSGSLGSVGDGGRTGYSQQVTATDPESGAIVYTLESGALPGGASLSSSGLISGNLDAVVSSTTYNFTIRARDASSNQTDRSFSITLVAPVIDTFSSTGAFSYSVPNGTTSVSVLVVAGGGGGGHTIGGGAGAGGFVESSSYPVSPGGSVPGSVGGGGSPGGGRGQAGGNGGDSIFGSITANGGGGGASWDTGSGSPGGSGGGASRGNGGGSANQGNFPSVGATGYGQPGGSGVSGGGGATQAGESSPSRKGGNGRSSSISGSSVTYAGGGGGGGGQQGQGSPGSGGSGGGGPGAFPGTPGQANRGGGGGGGAHPPDQPGGQGGSGIVIVKA
jgi:hypothetical protein